MSRLRKWWRPAALVVAIVIVAQVGVSLLVRTHHVHNYLVRHLERGAVKITPKQRRCLIEATIDPLTPFPRGFARSKAGPFFEIRTVRLLIDRGALRVVRPCVGSHRILLTARAA